MPASKCNKCISLNNGCFINHIMVVPYFKRIHEDKSGPLCGCVVCLVDFYGHGSTHHPTNTKSIYQISAYICQITLFLFVVYMGRKTKKQSTITQCL